MALRRILSSLALRRAPAKDCGCPEAPGGDPAFAAAVTALGAKLARADGRADPIEFDSFLAAFPSEPGAARDVLRLYRLAGETTLGFEAYARRLGKRYGGCPAILERIVEGLFVVAKSDGAVTADELAYLERVASLLGLSPLVFRRLRHDHLGAGPEDPYRLLEVAPDAPDDVVRQAWRRALVEHHPDKALGRGLPRDRVEAAFRRAAAINAAFDAVMLERRSLAGAA
jgi:DnaJ like chaperone protein